MRFHYDRGLKLTDIDLGVDVRRRLPRGFISHAHADHIAPHEMAYCTPPTADFYRARRGQHRRVVEMPFHQPLQWGPLRLTTLPSGHMFGCAMLLAESETGSLLYTGDFKLSGSATAAAADPPVVDTLIMESTFGDARYRFPPREEVLAEFFDLIDRTLAAGKTPLIRAYVLGKAQEVTRLLTSHGVPVQQHPLVYEMSQIYEKHGCDLGHYELYEDSPREGWAVVAPPTSQRAAPMPGLRNTVSFALTGWAMQKPMPARIQVDHALPLSDHAGYDELLEICARTAASTIYCTHGPVSFVTDLKRAGFNAFPLEGSHQGRFS